MMEMRVELLKVVETRGPELGKSVGLWLCLIEGGKSAQVRLLITGN